MSLVPRLFPILGILLVLPFAEVALPAQRDESPDPRFQGLYQELRDLVQRTPFGVPLRMQSEERRDDVRADVHAIIEHRFEVVSTMLASPASWCEFVLLNVTVKACAFRPQSHDTPLTIYVGPKGYQPPEAASPQPYRFVVHTRPSGVLSVALSAQEGVYGTTAHRLEMEAAGVNGRTVIALHTSYAHSAASKLATAIYLSTVGRNKVGFSREETRPGAPAAYVKGQRGMVERNIMRYYLALEAFLDTQSVPAPHRFEARLNTAYELMERYPLQLHDLEKAEYLDAKRREWENQLRLQQGLDGAAVRPVPR